MSKSDLEKFRAMVFEDERLEASLRDIEDRGRFIERVVALGAEHGLNFNADDVEEAMQHYQRAWIERHI